MSVRRIRPRWPLAIVALLVGLASTLLVARQAAPRAAATKGVFWKVTSATTTAYLMGSIHVASPDMYPLSPDIERAFRDARVLVVELDIAKVDKIALAASLFQAGMYAAGDSLDRHVSAKTFGQIRDAAKALGLPPEVLTQLKPMLASVTLADAAALKAGMNADLGIDQHFLDARGDRRIVELESIDSQIKLLTTDLTDKQAEASLAETAQQATNFIEEIQSLVNGWKTGDIDAIDRMTMKGADDPDARSVLDLMIYNRNDAMTRKIAELLGGRDPVFVVVGAAHLVGERGIARQLERQRFTVERPTLASAR